MQICKVKNYQELSRKAANLIAAQIILKPDSVLGLATGSSPVGTYDRLVEMYQDGDLDFSEITTVNLDEYKGLSGSHEQSYRYFMNTHLFHRINISYDHTYVPDGTETDSHKACQAYNELLHQVGPADLQITLRMKHIALTLPKPQSRQINVSSPVRTMFHVRPIPWESERSCAAKSLLLLSAARTKLLF